MRTIGIFIGIIGAAIGASGFGLFWWAHTTILQGNMNSGLHWLLMSTSESAALQYQGLGIAATIFGVVVLVLGLIVAFRKQN